MDHTTPIPEDIDMTEENSSYDLEDICMFDPEHQAQGIADLLKWSYALQLRSVMHTIVKKRCNGCYYDLASQLEHDVCIFMTFQEKVEKWYEEALDMVDEDFILGHWLGTLGHLHPTVRYHQISKYLDPTYRSEEWIDEDWKCDVKNKLLALEYYPF